MILSALVRMAEQTPFYLFTAFVFTYGTTVLGSSRDLILIAVLTASVLSFFNIPFSGYLSDRIGRRRMYMIGAACVGIYGFIYFALLNTNVPAWIFLAIVLSLIPHAMMYGPQAALIAESFPPRLRYSGASLGYQLASVIAGGPAPLIATALFARYQLGLRYRLLHPGLRDYQPCRRGSPEGLHEQGHLRRIRHAVGGERVPGCCRVRLRKRPRGGSLKVGTAERRGCRISPRSGRQTHRRSRVRGRASSRRP